MSENEKNQIVTFRVPKGLLESFDKSCLEGGDRAEKLRTMIMQEAEKSGGQTQVPGNYEKLKSDADGCRREMDRLKRAMGSKLNAVETVALNFAPLAAENVPMITQKLCSYLIEPQDGFDRGDVEDYIEFLEVLQKHDSLLKEIDSYRKARFGAAEPEKTLGGSTEQKTSTHSKDGKGRKRHINPKELCACGLFEKQEEHNRRCAYNLDTGLSFAGATISELKQRISNDPGKPIEKLLQSISDHLENFYGISANEKTRLVEYLKAHGTVKQKVMVNSYFFWRLFAVPFPECETFYKGKVVTEDLICQELRSFLMTPEESKLGETQLNLSKSIIWEGTDNQNNALTDLNESEGESESDSAKSESDS